MDRQIQLKNILIVCESKAVIAKIRDSLTSNVIKPEQFLHFRNIESTIAKIHEFIADNRKIDLIISDIFFHSSETSVVGLLNELEKYLIFQNTPLMIFTNVKDDGLLRQVRKACVHLPFRIVFTETNNKEIFQIFTDLIDFKIKNEKYLELETKIDSIIEMKNRNLLTPAIQMILALNKEDPKVCRLAKANYLVGKLYYSFWKVSNEELQKLTEKMSATAIASPEFTFLQQKTAKEGELNEKLLDNAQKYLVKSYEDEPEYWNTLDALYRLHMDKMEYQEAKKYLETLLKLYPNECKFSLQMGKIHEMNNDFNESIQFFLEATEKAVASGIGNIKREDLTEIIDASLMVGKRMMRQLNVEEMKLDAFSTGSNSDVMMKSIRKSNAQLRVTLERLSQRYPDEADLLNKIAITYRRTGEYHLAEEFYKKALNLEPDNVVILINYAMCLAATNVFGKATQVIEEAHKYQVFSEDEKKTLEKATELINKRDIVAIKKFLI